MPSQRIEQVNNEIKTLWFKDHVATYSQYKNHKGEVIESLRWGKPQSSIYCVHFWYSLGTLCAYGDIGDAVYQWHYSIGTLRNIAGCSIDYFASKCQASEHGRGYESWDEMSAREYMLDYIKSHVKDADEEDNDIENHFRSLGGWDELYSNDAWIDWLEEHGMDFFGDDFYEFGGIGMDVDIRCRSHLIGLKMAFEQIENQKEAVNA